MYRENTAYDFDLFSEKAKVVELPEKKNNKRSGYHRVGASQKRTSSVSLFRSKWVAVGGVVLALVLIVAQLFCQLKSSELVDQINTVNKEIRTLQSEHTRLQVELEGKTSFTNMENVAKEKGMQKMTVAQNHYINLYTEDSMEVVENDSALPAKVAELLR